jgi:hypothetical protein
MKYHPEDSGKRLNEQKTALMNRVKVFMDFFRQDKLDQVRRCDREPILRP